MALVVGGAALLGIAGLRWYFGGRELQQWECVAVHPNARYQEHGAAVVGESLVVVGGFTGPNTYNNGVLSLDLKSLTWSEEEPCPVSCAGHGMVVSAGELLLLVGLPSVHTLRVYKFARRTWEAFPTSGDTPASTRGHSATLIGNKVWVIGGQDFKERLMSDIHVLDLETKTWERVHASGSIPPPVSFHNVVPYQNRLYLFGGRTSFGLCPNLFVLDCDSMTCTLHIGCGIPREKFGAAVIGTNECYALGGSASEAMILNMDTMKWRVASSEPQLAGQGLSLVNSGESKAPLVAAAAAEDGFGVFALRPCKRLRKTSTFGICQVMAKDGSEWRFHVPKGGEPVGRILDSLRAESAVSGTLKRGLQGLVLSSSELVFPGEEVTLDQAFSLPIRQELRMMSVKKCKAYLAQVGVKVWWGKGWLEPSRELSSPGPFAWRDGQQAAQQYLEKVGGLKLYALNSMHYDHSNKWEVEFISRCGEVSGILQTDMLIVRATFMEPFTPLIGFMLQGEMSEESRWRAAVMLLAFSIQSPDAKPWMVISDLGEMWEFAWMDGMNMFVSGASSGKQGRGIFRDLVRDYHTVLDSRLVRNLSGLPSVFDREEVKGFDRIVDPALNDPLQIPLHIYKKTPATGGIQVRRGLDSGLFFAYKDCHAYSDESEVYPETSSAYDDPSDGEDVEGLIPVCPETTSAYDDPSDGEDVEDELLSISQSSSALPL